MKIFLSYSHRDDQFAETVYHQLKAWGFETWIDFKGIPLASYWTGEIDEALEWADITLGLMTPHAIRSENVQNEWFWTIRYEEEKNKRLILLKRGEFTVPHYLVRRNWLDYDELGEQLCYETLHQRLDEPVENIERYSTPAVTDSYRDYLQTLYSELEAELDFLVLSVERMIDISAGDTPEHVQNIRKKSDKPRMLPGFSRRNMAQNEEFPIENFKSGFDTYDGRLLLLGNPGTGKTITLLTHARDAVLTKLQDVERPLPFIARIATWTANPPQPLHEWLAETSGLSVNDIQRLIGDGKCLLMLDGLDELGPSRHDVKLNPDTDEVITEKVQEIDPLTKEPMVDDNGTPIMRDVPVYESYDPRLRFLQQLPENNQVVITSRVVEYMELAEKINLNGAVQLRTLSEEQIESYLSISDELRELWQALEQQPDLLDVARVPLLLSLLAFAFQGLPDRVRNLKDMEEGELRDAIFEQYIKKRYDHEVLQYELRGDEIPYTISQIYDILGHVAMRNACIGVSTTESEEAASPANATTDNVLGIKDFSFILDDESKILDFVEFMIRLHIFVGDARTEFRFIHLLLRDYFVYNYCLPRVFDAEQYIMGGPNEINPAKALSRIGDPRAFDRLVELYRDRTKFEHLRDAARESIHIFIQKNPHLNYPLLGFDGSEYIIKPIQGDHARKMSHVVWQNEAYARPEGFLRIGRSVSNDIVINRSGIARYHVMIRRIGKDYILYAVNTSFREVGYLPVEINNNPVSEPYTLNDGDLIQIGDEELRFVKK